MTVDLRPAEPGDIEALAALWHAGWHDAHAKIVPAALTELRTLASFRDRLRAGLAMVRVAGPGAPLGFAMVRKDELYQLYVDPGRGEAASRAPLLPTRRAASAGMVSHAPGSIAPSGTTAPLRSTASGVGSTRAPRLAMLDTSQGPFEMEAWRFERAL